MMEQYGFQGLIIIFLIGIAYRDIEFKIEFDLNIIEKSGRLNKCSVELEIPDETLFKNGIVINRLSLSNFSFEVK